MLEQRIYEYLCMKQRGLTYEIPDDYQFAKCDRPYVGKFVIPGKTAANDPGLTFAEAGERTDVVWVAPSLSTSSRDIKLKSMSSVRGHFVDDKTNRTIMFESMLEFFAANILMAQPTIVNIEDQPPELEFDLDGPRTHTLDYRSTDAWGRRIGYAIKPQAHLEADRTSDKVDALKRLHCPSFAQDILVLTEVEISRESALNAIDINRARKSRCQADCDRVLDTLRDIGEPIKLWKLQDRIGDDGLVWNAVLNLHYDRAARILRPGLRFNDECLVQAHIH